MPTKILDKIYMFKRQIIYEIYEIEVLVLLNKVHALHYIKVVI